MTEAKKTKPKKRPLEAEHIIIHGQLGMGNYRLISKEQFEREYGLDKEQAS